MHMSDALITPVVGGTMLASSGGVMSYAVRSIKPETFEERLPLMGVMGAFLFAAQMINFAIPGTGSSGHIGGGMLLSIILGPGAAFVTMACVLLIQALFFADGGLLAFGCNLINLGFFTAYVAYPLIFKPITRRVMNRRTIMIGAIAASIVGLQLGSLGVVAETWISGRTELSLGVFLMFMQPIHLAIGLVEGVITATIVAYLYSQNRQLIYSENEHSKNDTITTRGLLLRIMIVALLVGGIFSLAASGSPDGLEWAIERTAGDVEILGETGVHGWFEGLQERAAFLPDYGFASGSLETAGTTVSGIVGSLITLVITFMAGTLIRQQRRRLSQGE